jgi:hypothetical protein
MTVEPLHESPAVGVCLRLASAIEKEGRKPQYLSACSCRPKSQAFWANVPYWRDV